MTKAQEDRLAFLRHGRFAHRGLHGAGIVENSRAAFTAAIAAGDGIELDVQLSGDGEAMVFHDETLDRLTGSRGRLFDMAASTLSACRLNGTDEGIATLREIVALVAGRAPILVEIKAKRQDVVAPLCRAVTRAIHASPGPIAIMSFNPSVCRWFAAHAPGVIRGLVVTEQGQKSRWGNVRRWAALLYARPQFLAYDIADIPSPFAEAARRRGLPLLSWTVRTPEQQARAARHVDAPIYETVSP